MKHMPMFTCLEKLPLIPVEEAHYYPLNHDDTEFSRVEKLYAGITGGLNRVYRNHGYTFHLMSYPDIEEGHTKVTIVRVGEPDQRELFTDGFASEVANFLERACRILQQLDVIEEGESGRTRIEDLPKLLPAEVIDPSMMIFLSEIRQLNQKEALTVRLMDPAGKIWDLQFPPTTTTHICLDEEVTDEFDISGLNFESQSIEVRSRSHGKLKMLFPGIDELPERVSRPGAKKIAISAKLFGRYISGKMDRARYEFLRFADSEDKAQGQDDVITI